MLSLTSDALLSITANSEHASELQRLRGDHDKELTSVRAQLERANGDLERCQRELKETATSTGADLTAAKSEVARLTGVLAGVEKDLASSKAACDQANRLVEGLKAQVEELRREAKDIAKEAAAKLAVCSIDS